MPELIAGPGITLTPNVGAGTLTIEGGGGGASVGATANDSTNASTAIMAALTAAKATAVTGYQYGNAAGRLTASKGAPAYRLSSTIDIDISVALEGDSRGFPPGTWTSLFHPDAGVTAIRVQAWDTDGATGTNAGDAFTGAGSTIAGIGVLGRYNGTTNLEAEAHGYHIRATAAIRDGAAFSMQGDGVHLRAGVGLPEKGGANCWQINRFWSQENRNGFYAGTSDVNAGVSIQLMSSQCRQWAILDEAGAANIHIGALSQLCGVWGLGTTDSPAAACHYSGKHYSVRAGQEAGAVTNAPSGTTSDNTWWLYFEAGGVVVPGFPTWVSGMVWRAGGSYRIVNGGVNLNPYEEGDQPPSQHGGAALTIGGSHGPRRPVGGGYINAGGHQVLINDLRMIGGGLNIDDDVSGAISVGRYGSGNPAIIRATVASPSLALCAPNGSQHVVIQNTELDLFSVYVLSTNLNPFTDNAVALGGSSHRYTELWAASATIQTSDRHLKQNIRKLSGKPFEALLDAVGSVPLVAFKFKDAVKAKGKKARQHYGIIAQDLAEALEARGLDPFAGGVLGRDPVFEEVEEEAMVEREASRIEVTEHDEIEVVDGKAVLRKVMVEREVGDFIEVPVHDENDEPIIIPGRPEQKLYVPAVDEAGRRRVAVGGKVRRFSLDENLKPVPDRKGPLVEIVQPEIQPRPMTHPVRRMEEVTEKRTVRRPKLVKGEQEWIWNVRYDEFWALRQAWMEREMRRA